MLFLIALFDFLPFALSTNLNYTYDTSIKTTIFKNSSSTINKIINSNANFITCNNTGKLLGKRYISSTTTQALNNVASNSPELAPLVAVTLTLLVVLPPICLALRNFISLDAPLMQRMIDNPQDFVGDSATLQEFEDKKLYLSGLTDIIPYDLSYVNRLRQLLDQVLTDHTSIPRVLFDQLDLIIVKLQSFSSGLSILLQSYANILFTCFEDFYGQDGAMDQIAGIARWTRSLEEISNLFLANYDIFVVSGLIS